MAQTSTEAVALAREGPTLEGVLHRPAGSQFPAAIVCHPHPLYGGDMSNNVVTGVCQALAEAGIAALRFNYRGVGRSEGSFGDGIGERDDARSALAYLRGLPEVDETKVGVIGYSFGAGVAVAAADERTAAVVGISTPTFGRGLPDLAFRCPTMLISGEQDQVAPPGRLAALAEAVGRECQVAIVRGADHFWWGQEEKLAEEVARFVRRAVMGEAEASPETDAAEQS
jgi:alpha/beta superfamily hydrolase